jgi:hypothetical protein
MNQLLSVLIFVGIIPFCYFLLWISPDRPGSWRRAGRLRRIALHVSLWFSALYQIALISFGLGAFLLTAPLHYLFFITFIASIASSIVTIEVIGTVIKSSDKWSNRKRIIIASIIALTVFVFANIIALIVRTKSGMSYY